MSIISSFSIRLFFFVPLITLCFSFFLSVLPKFFLTIPYPLFFLSSLSPFLFPFAIYFVFCFLISVTFHCLFTVAFLPTLPETCRLSLTISFLFYLLSLSPLLFSSVFISLTPSLLLCPSFPPILRFSVSRILFLYFRVVELNRTPLQIYTTQFSFTSPSAKSKSSLCRLCSKSAVITVYRSTFS